MRTGSCLCGQVQYRVSGEPLTARICWCRDCQHIAGNGSVNAMFPAAAIEFSGQLREFVSTADSGNQICRQFCPACGSHVFAKSSARPQFTMVRVGTLHDPSSLRPQMNIWASSAPVWAHLDPAIERLDNQPSPPLQPPPR